MVRALVAQDFDRVVELDRRLLGRSRGAYFEKRLQAALRRPKRHLQIAFEDRGRILGFALARLAGGEFGRREPVVVLETIGVDPEHQQQGLGARLLASLEDLAGKREIGELVTQASWRELSMLRFLKRGGFELAPRALIERPVERVSLFEGDSKNLEKTPIPVRRLAAEDFDAILRIDRATTGLERTDYLQRKFDEVLNESALVVSLVAEEAGLPIAFVMARVDFGEFGQLGAVAALDTISVRPGFGGKGVGRVLLLELVNNLAALHVERLESEVARETFALLGFLYHEGFRPSQRLSFRKRLDQR